MLNSKIVFFFLLISCGTTTDKPVVVTRALDDLQQLKSRCENEMHALSCARYGYLQRDILYTKEACRLGDENSCFNVREIENRVPNQNFAIISSNNNQIFSCYVNHSIDLDNGEGMKSEKEINLFFLINPLGKISSLSVQGQKISERFKECVIHSFSSKKFLTLDHDQSIQYNFVMPAVKTDRRMLKNGNNL